jgi:ABC-type transporter Mla subunit MlaD
MGHIPGMRPLLLVMLSLTLGLAACGEEGGVSADEAAQRAGELAERTQQLAGEVARTGRTLVEDPDSADAARDRLRVLEDQAREAAEDADGLPKSTRVGEELEQAGDRIADAAARLADAEPDGRDALADARSQLGEAADQIDEAASALERQLPDDVRRELDALREDLGSRP